MLENMPKDLKTKAYVLRRTNFGEADRILNIISPVGKISALAKGVRKPKSKLAGGIEMFSLIEVNLHFGKSDMATLTGARMITFYGEILKDLPAMELASEILKKISVISDSVDSAEHFEIVDECLFCLNDGCDKNLVEAWFLMQAAKAMGEQINLLTDVDGEDLSLDARYNFDMMEMSFCKNPDGVYDANAIKLLRLLWAADLKTVRRVKDAKNYLPEILKIAKAVNKVVK